MTAKKGKKHSEIKLSIITFPKGKLVNISEYESVCKLANKTLKYHKTLLLLSLADLFICLRIKISSC